MTIAPLLAMLVLLVPVRGEEEIRVGAPVVMKSKDGVRVGDLPPGGGGAFRVYVVAEVAPGRLRLASNGAGGWVDAAEVVALDRAVDHFTAVLRGDPRAAWAYARRGAILQLSRGALDRSIADLTEAIRLDPRDALAFSLRADTRSLRGDSDGAIADYDAALRIDPKRPRTLCNRGLTRLNETREYDKAVVDIDAAIRLDPGDALAVRARGQAHARLKDFARAVADDTAAIALAPNDAQVFVGRGLCWEELREQDKAVADFSEAIRLDPKSPVALINRGVVWRKKRDFARAVADFSEAIRLAPGEPYGYNALAMLRASCPDGTLRDGKQAVELARKAFDLPGGRSPVVASTVAAAYAEAGDFPKAVEWETIASDLLADEQDKRRSRSRIELYKQKTPYRDPG